MAEPSPPVFYDNDGVPLSHDAAADLMEQIVRPCQGCGHDRYEHAHSTGQCYPAAGEGRPRAECDCAAYQPRAVTS